ncbi:hypothetical protein VFPPC_15788 [Pochonia chlamydosporia 170]|uniref:Uncharacterized protein n=1 Tax=Pochonia chlamydosporia 170 TaxID=1380566 RepID=A0A179FSZ5_METCM|nr:hypothetical protein VFPPC_15788 [Pochonia chlamydosporia 170]OAQ68139.1 hypothetical protein VFPPC_15788 [Pochonia chlamydosporia 170]
MHLLRHTNHILYHRAHHSSLYSVHSIADHSVVSAASHGLTNSQSLFHEPDSRRRTAYLTAGGMNEEGQLSHGSSPPFHKLAPFLGIICGFRRWLSGPTSLGMALRWPPVTLSEAVAPVPQAC